MRPWFLANIKSRELFINDNCSSENLKLMYSYKKVHIFSDLCNLILGIAIIYYWKILLVMLNKLGMFTSNGILDRLIFMVIIDVANNLQKKKTAV